MAKDKNSLAAVTEQLEELNKKQDKELGDTMKIQFLTKKRNELAAKASGLSEKEAARRFKHDQDMKKLQEKIEAAKEAGGDDAPEARSNQKIMDKMKRREDIRRALNLQNAVSNLGNKFTEGFSSLGEKAKSGAGLLLKGAGVIALFAFLQSDTFKSVVKGIVDFVFDVIDLFTGEKSGLDFIKDNFGILLAAVSAFAIKIMGIGPFLSMIATPAIALLKLAFAGLFGPKGILIKNLVPQLKTMALTNKMAGGGKLKFLGKAISFVFKGIFGALKGFLVAAAPIVGIVALVAAIAYAVVRVFQGFQEYFSEANEQFGFFGGILAGFTGGIKMILSDVASVIDSILGFFGFPDVMDPIIKAIEDFDVMDFVGGIMDFFSNLGNIIMESLSSFAKLFKAIAAGAKAAIFSPFSPIESFNKAFDEVMSGGEGGTPANADALTQQNMMQNRVAGVQNLGTDLGALQAQQSELERGRIAANIVNNNNVVQKGGDVYNEKIETVSISDPNQSPFAQLV